MSSPPPNPGPTAQQLANPVVDTISFNMQHVAPIAPVAMTGELIVILYLWTDGNFYTVDSNGNRNLVYAVIQNIRYVDKDTIRGIDGPVNRLCTIENLGVFAWIPGDATSDDGELCFATASGRWVLYGASFDLMHAYIRPEIGS